MATTWTAVRSGLATRLATISGLNVHEFDQDSINIPCALIDEVEIGFDHTGSGNRISGGLDVYDVIVRVFTGTANDQSGQARLDAYFAKQGASSIYAALMGDNTLGGVASSVQVLRQRGYGRYPYGAIEYRGAIFDVRVIG